MTASARIAEAGRSPRIVGWPEIAFRNEDLSAMLTASAVADVIAQLNGRGTSRPRTPDEWYELVRNHGAA